MKFAAPLIITLGMFFDQSCSRFKWDSEGNASAIDLQILEDKLVTKKDSLIVRATSNFTNSSPVNYLLYNAKAAEPSYKRFENCEDSAGANFGSRIAYTVLNSKGEIMKSHFTIADNETRVTADSLQLVLSQSRNDWINNRIILKSNQSQIVNHSFRLEGLELEKGKYFIYLFYREGSFLKEHLGEERIKQDEKDSNARLFLGCIKSNTVSLIVE